MAEIDNLLGSTRRVVEETTPLNNCRGVTYRVVNVGSGSGDQHNLGWYATPEALRTVHPTATAGDWAIVGSTDTVWIWDTDTNAWKDSNQEGQVASVNGQTGTVVLTASDVGAATAAQGAKADTAIQSVKTINGQSIVGTGDVTVGGLPSQTGQSGKFLTTDGSSASWSNKPLTNKSTGEDCLSIEGSAAIGYRRINIGSSSQATGDDSIVLGVQASASGDGSVAIGYLSKVSNVGTWGCGLALGKNAKVTADGAIQIGYGTNSTANSFQVYRYQLLDLTTGTIPEARLADTTNASAGQVLTLDSNLNAVWQAGGSGGGVSDVTVNGTSVVSGGVATITGMLQNTATGRRSLSLFGVATSADDAINIGLYSEAPAKGIAIGYNAISATNMWHGGIAIGDDAYARTVQVAIGSGAQCYNQGLYGIAIGQNARTSADSAMQIQLADSIVTNSDANTVKIANANGNFEMMSADGTIPAARHAALPSADGTYVLKLVIADGVPTLSWVAE